MMVEVLEGWGEVAALLMLEVELMGRYSVHHSPTIATIQPEEELEVDGNSSLQNGIGIGKS